MGRCVYHTQNEPIVHKITPSKRLFWKTQWKPTQTIQGKNIHKRYPKGHGNPLCHVRTTFFLFTPFIHSLLTAGDQVDGLEDESQQQRNVQTPQATPREENQPENEISALAFPYQLSYGSDYPSMRDALNKWAKELTKEPKDIWDAVVAFGAWDCDVMLDPISGDQSKVCELLQKRMDRTSAEQQTLGRLQRNRFSYI